MWKKRFFAALTALTLIFVITLPGMYNVLFAGLWPLVKQVIHRWDGPEEHLVTENGTQIILQYERGDEAAAVEVKETLEGAVETASSWGRIPFPVTVRIVRDSLALKLIPSDLVMQPIGRAFDDLVLLLSPSAYPPARHGERRPQRIGSVLSHELTHINAQWMTGNYGSGFGSEQPWFVEGIARHTAGEADWWHEERVVEQARIPPPNLVYNWWVFYTVDPATAYESSGVLFARLHEKGRDRLLRFMEALRNGQSFKAAFRQEYGMSPKEFVELWWLEAERKRAWDELGVALTQMTREQAEEECAKDNSSNGLWCNHAFERLYACPQPNVRGACKSEYEVRMFGEYIVNGELNPIGWVAWSSDCECMDLGP